MPFDAHANLAISSVAVAPVPPDTGTSLTVASGQGSRFPAPPFNVTIWAASSLPTPTTAEVARVTARVGDVLTLVRAAEPPAPARTVVIGDLIAETITAKALQDIESGTNFPLISTPGPITSGGTVTGAIGQFGNLGTTPLPLHAATHAAAGSDPVAVTALAGYPGDTTTFLRADGTFTAASGGVPAAHHLTHETGGTDAVVSLSAAVLTSGTLPDARLSSNVPLKTVSNVFTTFQEIQAALVLRNPAGPVDQKVWNLTSNGTDLGINPTTDNLGSIRPGTLTVAGSATVTGTAGNVACKDQANVFTANQTLQKGLPLLQWFDTSGITNQRAFSLYLAGSAWQLDAVNDAGGTVLGVLAITRTGTLSVANALFERNRSTALGEWIDVPYNAANFTADVGTWTVEPGAVGAYHYTLIGKTLILSFAINTSSVAGTPTELRIALPGVTVAQNARAIVQAVNAGGGALALASALPGQAFLSLFAAAPNTTAFGVTWATATNTTLVAGQLSIRIA